MATIHDVLDNYFKLRAFCDSYLDAVTQRYGDRLACRPGCCGCCTLTGVNMLEAAVLLQALRGPVKRQPRPAAASSIPEDETPCPLLRDGRCGAYAARPLICRTHGLPLRGVSLTSGRTDCCPLNFRSFDLSFLAPELVLDVDAVTMNLMRLNLAFCMILENRSLAGERLSLASLLSGTIPKALAEALQEND